MSLSTRIVQLALLGFSGLAFYSFYTVLVPKGLQESLNAFAAQKVLPDTSISVDGLKYSGIDRIDRFLNALNYFFWPILHDNDYVRKTRSKMFIGQFMAGYTLVMLEAERPGNRGRIVSYIALWGLATQSVGWGLSMPTWMAITIGGAYIANPRSLQIIPESRAGRAIPWAVFVGFLIPGILAYLPAPEVLTYKQKMQAMAAWQVFPIWVSLAHQIFKRLLPDQAVDTSPRKTSGWRLPGAVKSPYIFILVVSGVIRVGSIARIVYDIQSSSKQGPPTWDIFRQLFIPQLLDPSIKYDALAAGSSAFLEWDEVAGQTALMLFAAFQYFKVSGQQNGSSFTFVLFGVPLIWLIFGASGVAVAFLAMRDDLVIRQEDKVKKLKH